MAALVVAIAAASVLAAAAVLSAPGAALAAPEPKTRRFNKIAFSPDGRYLAAAPHMGVPAEVVVWSLADGRRPTAISTAEFNVSHLTFSPDGASLVMAAADGRVASFSPTSGALVREIWQAEQSYEKTPMETGGRRIVFLEGLAFTHDGKALAVACPDDRMRIIDVASGAILREVRGNAPREGSIGLDKRGRLAVVPADAEKGADEVAPAGEAISLVDMGTGRRVAGISGEGHDPGGFVVAGDRAVVYQGLFDVVVYDDSGAKPKELLRVPLIPAEERKARTLTKGDLAKGLTISADGARAAFCRLPIPGNVFPEADDRARIVVIDAIQGKVIASHKVAKGRSVNHLTLAPDGKTLAVPGQGTILVIDAATGATLQELRVDESE